uniref:DNA helicase Pif1-like 2B domain-containing protein n=1 Tax=Octopus bimaculoides TaxID=37653 RepID=A0A0L8I4I1_OCTBM
MEDGDSHIYKSINKVVHTDNAVPYTVEFLNSLELASMLPHNFELKKGAVIMLLRNWGQPRLCDGACMVVTELQPHIIKAKSSLDIVFIPGIPLIPTAVPFHFK